MSAGKKYSNRNSEWASLSEHKSYDLADHFLACAKLGRYLTVASDDRFVITDDFKKEGIIHEAAAVAAIYSKDYLVAEAALLPLGGRMDKMPTATRDKYERLFDLIAEESLCDTVRGSAKALVEARFREAEIRALDSQLRDSFVHLLLTLAAKWQSTLIFVSHDNQLAHHFQRTVMLTEINRAEAPLPC